jgi:hypothetical protein
MDPLQLAGDGVVTVGLSVLPQASVTTGAVGATAFAGQFTVDVPSAGNVKSGAAIVYVYFQS